MEENDKELKAAVVRLSAQDNFLATTAQTLSQDQNFVKGVLEQATNAMGSQLAQALAEQKHALSSLDQRVQPMLATLGRLEVCKLLSTKHRMDHTM